MTERAWPSQRTRRALRHAFWRHRRAIRALLVGLAVLCAVQAVSSAAGDRSLGERQAGTSSSAARTDEPVADGLVTAVVRVADPSSALVVRAGSIVDILATPAETVAQGSVTGVALADVVAPGVRVVRVPDSEQITTTEGAVFVVAVTPTTARALAAAADQRLSVVVRSAATGP